jgi:hypothetical protein
MNQGASHRSLIIVRYYRPACDIVVVVGSTAYKPQHGQCHARSEAAYRGLR